MPRTLRHAISGAPAVTSSGIPFAASPMISMFRVTASWVRSSATKAS